LLRRTLNLGILAHVDAGKTTLTERLLYLAGVVDAPGSVDAGTTQTDSLSLEQQRGITIKSAVVSFAVDDVVVNLIDTPGHPDFIAEVERVLSVLDGVILVISAIEGVQPQTVTLARALKRLQLPTLLFVNKIDRRGANTSQVVAQIAKRLTSLIVEMGAVRAAGTRGAINLPHRAEDAAFRSRLVGLLAEQDDSLLGDFVEDEAGLSPSRLLAELARQTHRALVHPIFFGSALTGVGVGDLMRALPRLLPAEDGDVNAPVSASVFKVDRGPRAEKIAYVRIFAGTLRVRDRVFLHRPREDDEAKVTALSVYDGGLDVRADAAFASQIVKLWGLTPARIGDTIGEPPPRTPARLFAPPTLEAVAVVRRAVDKPALFAALTQLSEQDPLINVRRLAERHEILVSLYGEVQKEVIAATLASDYGIDIDFLETRQIYIERPLATAEAEEKLHADTNPFLATMAFRVEPAVPGSGIEFRLDIDPRAAPLYLFKTLESFRGHVEEYARETLQEGLFGWEVTDCIVTLIRCEYSVPDGPPSRRGPLSTAADFRKLTPVVLIRALVSARTVVCEPMLRGRLELPTTAIGPVMAALGRLGGSVEMQSAAANVATIEALLPAARADELRRQLPGLTSGEGVLETTLATYRPVLGTPPTRQRTTPNPLNLNEYLRQLKGFT
jgi:ribosomal protection tetracycline resistance protein